MFLTLEPIPEERRQPEHELWDAFETERPRILGALGTCKAEGEDHSMIHSASNQQ